LIRAIAAGDLAAALPLLAASPELAKEHLAEGPTRREAKAHWFDELGHYVYAGDTPSTSPPLPVG
jgi:hypothetical protein